MDKAEILAYAKRFVEKHGYRTTPYASIIATGSPDPDFAVYKGMWRLGTVTFDKGMLWLEAWYPDFRKDYKFNPHDPDSLPNLVEQIKASLIALRGLNG